MIIVCLFSSRCSACREVYEWICLPGDGCVDAAICTVLTVTVFLCMDHFIYLICWMSSSAGPDIIALPYLTGLHLSLAQVSVGVSNCTDATGCSSFHPVRHSSCHRKPGQKLTHVRFQGNFSPPFFKTSSCMLVDSWQSAWWEVIINCPQLKTKLM